MKTDINGIIKEEISNYIHEQENTNNQSFNFKQKIEDRNVYFINYDELAPESSSIENSNIIVNWSVAFWLDESGIENFIPSINSVEGTFSIEIWNNDTGDTEDVNEYDINQIDWRFDIDEVNANIKMNNSLYVKGIEFDVGRKLCTVSF